MRLLLDTHILLWLLVDSDRLGEDARAVIDDPSAHVFASAISVLEVAVKWALRRGAADDMPLSGRDFAKALDEAGVDLLDIRVVHAAALDDLPLHHRDPFDRLLIATARHEGMQLVTRDTALGVYGAEVRLV